MHKYVCCVQKCRRGILFFFVKLHQSKERPRSRVPASDSAETRSVVAFCWKILSITSTVLLLVHASILDASLPILVLIKPAQGRICSHYSRHVYSALPCSASYRSLFQYTSADFIYHPQSNEPLAKQLCLLPHFTTLIVHGIALGEVHESNSLNGNVGNRVSSTRVVRVTTSDFCVFCVFFWHCFILYFPFFPGPK